MGYNSPMTMRMRFAVLLLTLSAASAAVASPTDDTAVIRHCGPPLSQNRAQNPATNEFTEDFFYPADVVIHFLPVDGGWTLDSAWMRHIPVSRDGLADRMPCVREALTEAAEAPKPLVDSTIAAQTVQSESRRGFGIPFLWLIFLLILTLLVAVIIPTPRKREPERPLPRAPQRLPEVVVQERIRQSSASQKAAK